MNRFAVLLRGKSLGWVTSRRISGPAPSQRVFVVGVGMTKVSMIVLRCRVVCEFSVFQ